MANRYFERAEELERAISFQTSSVLHHGEARTG